MNPAFWIAIMAVLGAVFGYLVFRDAAVGVAAGVIVGAVIYYQRRELVSRGK